jgi:hypothetical protein
MRISEVKTNYSIRQPSLFLKSHGAGLRSI